ncbi:MAG: DMT family transporter [Candidatus Heimdallarchaeota archaeon]|nr:DMT family transporter [Candidatus Heimdallarchaeota archaeon]
MMDEYSLSVALAFIAAISWGINSHIMKKAMVGENPMRAIGIRSAFTAPLLIIIVALISGIDAITIYFTSELAPLVSLTAVLIIFGDGIFLFGLKHYDVSEILPIASTYPFFTVVILILTDTEDIGYYTILGTIFIIIGVAIVTRYSNGEGSFSARALMIGLGAGFCWGTSIFFVRVILTYDDTDAFGLTGVRTLFMGIMGYIIYLSSKEQRDLQKLRSKEEKISSIKFLALSGIVGWAIGAVAFFWAVQMIGAGIPTPISSVNPVIASVIGIFYGLEKITTKQFLGILFSVLGTITILVG